MERYRSGHNGPASKAGILGNRERGFESHPLRFFMMRGKKTPAELELLISKHMEKVFLYETNVDTPSLRTLSKIEHS